MKTLKIFFSLMFAASSMVSASSFAAATNSGAASQTKPQVLATKAGSASAAVNTSFLSDLWATRSASRWKIRRTIHVDVGAANASDANSGINGAPLKTLAAALKLVKPGTRILLHPGRYPESVTIGRNQSGTAREPVIIEAVKPGTAVLTGSDVWKGWKPDGAAGDYSHAWPHQWGLGPDAFADAGASIKPLGLRAEMVFVNRKPFRQVLERAQLAPGTFWVSEEEKKIVLRMPPGENPDRARIEVAVRKFAIGMNTIWGKLSEPHDWPSYYVLRGLSAEHYTGEGEYGNPAVTACGAHFLIEDCRFTWNNATGLALRGTDIVIRRTISDNNGSSGISAPPNAFPSIQNVLMEDVQASGNNWRGAMGDFYGYAVAGMKLMTSGNVVLRRFISNGNASPGVWLDKENRNFLLENCRFIGNKNGPGLWMEISEGPFLVRDCVSAFNADGVMISNSSEITLLRNTLYGNTSSQIGEWSPAIDREGFYDLALTLQDNIIVSTDGSQALWRRPDYPNIYNTLRSRRNLWHSPTSAAWFIGSEALDFSGWLTRTRQDTTSLWAAPRLRNPAAGDFRPRADSPLARRASWGTRSAVTLLPKRGLIIPDAKIYMTTESGAPVHYTLDGTDPLPTSPIYTAPIPATRRITVKAKVFDANPRDNAIATTELVGIAPPTPDIFLSDLTPLKNVVGWGEKARKDRSIADAALRISGISFTRGIGAHAPSELWYDIPEGAERFVSVVGIDDNVVGKASGKSSVSFAVYADDALLTKTAVLREGDLLTINEKIPAGSRRLRLVITDGGDSANWDQANWAQAGFIMKGKTP